MRKMLLLALFTAASILFGPGSVRALTIDATVGAIFTDSTLATPVPFISIDGGHIAQTLVSPGNVVVIDIAVSNAPLDTITAIFATLIVPGGDKIDSVLGTVLPPQMLQEPGFGGGSLANVNTGDIKGNSPGPGWPSDDIWIQAPSYALAAGTTGAGPDVIQIALIVGAGLVPNDSDILFEMGMTDGDAIAGASEVNFVSALITPLPEPSTALLIGLGLAGLALRRD